MGKKYRQYVERSRVCVGVDVHKVSWSVTIIEGDEVVKYCTIPGNWKSLKQLLSSYSPPEVTVSYEAGYFGYRLHDEVIQWGGHCFVIAPSLIPQESGNRVKIDRKDSHKLSYFLSKEMLKPIYVPPAENRAERHLIRTRSQLMEDRRRVQCRIKAMLSFMGVAGPEETAWSALFLEQLKKMVFGQEAERFCFEIYLREYESVTALIHQLTQEIQRLAKEEKHQAAVKIISSTPGLGTLSAMEFLLEVEDFTRFESGDRLAAYVGLTPSQYSSGEKTRLGRITKSGKTHLRATLIEAAWTTIKKDSGLKQKYERIKARSGGKRAIVAIARNLVIRLWTMLKNQQSYQLPQTT